MSKFNKRKDTLPKGSIAGCPSSGVGHYSKAELLRRVTLSNLLFESSYYQSADTIMQQIERLVPKVDADTVIQLALECRFEQKLRHTPLWLLLLAHEYHGVSIRAPLARIASRPDMLMDLLKMRQVRGHSIRKIPSSIKKGMAQAFDSYTPYQLAKYQKSKAEISLVDVVNLVHPRPTPQNEQALRELVQGTLAPANTWEVALSQGGDKNATFDRMINEGSLGSLAILRNLRNMKKSGLSRAQIKKAISQVRSNMLTPLNFLAAQRVAPEFTQDLNQAMKRCFADYQISGTTIVAIDISGSMGQVTSSYSNFSRMDLAFAMAALAGFVFEDVILVFTAGSDGLRKGQHMVASNTKGLGIFEDFSGIREKIGGGGIFTHQLTQWLIEKGYAADADRLVVISDSQDIDVAYGKKVKPDTRPYSFSYIIDISPHTHGIKTGQWTAEINGWSDKLFHYIAALEA